MKKFVPLFLCLFCLVKPCAGSVRWDFSTRNSISSVNAVLDNGNIKYRLSIRQNEKGLFSIEMPPSFSIAAGKVKLGELKIIDNTLYDTDTPSLNPGYAGIAYKDNNFSIAAFTPSLSPDSPTGGFISCSFENLEASVLYSYPNLYNTTNSVNSYQRDWSKITSAGRTVKSKLNIKTSFSSTTLYYSSNQFNGCNVSCDTNLYLYGFSANFKLGQNRISEVCFSIPGTISTELSYYSEKGKKPIYGGTAQKADISFKIKTSYKDFFFSSSSRNIFDEDTGHRSISSFTLGAFTGDFSCDLTFQNIRTKGTDKVFFISSADFETGNLSVSFSKGKTKVVLTRVFDIEGIKIEVSVNQDKEIAVSGEFKY